MSLLIASGMLAEATVTVLLIARQARTRAQHKRAALGQTRLADREEEAIHVIVRGSTGLGMSVCMRPLVERIRGIKPGGVLGPSGDYMREFYDLKRDLIINPFDARAEHWTPENEARRDAGHRDPA
jgi:hypothetical protein